MIKISNVYKGFTLIELMVVMLIIGIGLMTVTPKMTQKSVGVDKRLIFFDDLIKEHLIKAKELGRPISFTGFKGSANILTYDGKTKSIPDTSSIQKVIVNNYETRNEEYNIRIYPDGIVDHFILITKNNDVIESLPLLMKSRYSKYEDN